MTPKERAQAGYTLIREGICELLAQHPEGLRNVDIAKHLNLRTTFGDKNEDYLTWSVLGMLIHDVLVVRRNRRYFLAENAPMEEGSKEDHGGVEKI